MGRVYVRAAGSVAGTDVAADLASAGRGTKFGSPAVLEDAILSAAYG